MTTETTAGSSAESTAAAAATTAAAKTGPATAETAAPSRWAKWATLAIAVAAVWLVVLAILAATTANPVVLNRRQIAAATLVVDADAKTIYSVSVVRGLDVDPASIIFARPFKDSGRYLVPLRPIAGNAYEVVAVRLDRDRDPVPLYYRATDESRAQLATLLGE